ncbi:MAG: sialidase family protein [Acidobacteriota bacterium]|nr:sialidase family protein [Acidobacteriota bacterium]
MMHGHWIGIRHLLLLTVLTPGLFQSRGCDLRDFTEITISPRTIVAGLGDVELQVSAGFILEGTSIRVDGVVYPSSTVSMSTLSCILPREATLPSDIAMPQRTAVVELVDAAGRPLSDPAELTILRDYRWSPPIWIADLPHPDRMTVYRTATGSLILLFRQDRNLHLAVSRDGGSNWEVDRDFFALADRYEPYFFIPRDEDTYRLFFMADGAVAFTILTRIPAEPVIRRLPWTQGCSSFRAALDNRDRLHLIWDYQNFSGPSRIHHAYSDDLGDGWSEPSMVLDDPGYWPFYMGINGLAAHNGESVFVSYVINQGRYQFDRGRRSRDGGLTWTDGTPLDWEKTVFFTDDSIVRHGRTMYIPYMYKPFISRSTDGGDTWTTVFYPENEPYSTIGWIIPDSWGNLLGELTDSAAGTKVMIRSFDNGASWIIPDDTDPNLPPGHSLTGASVDERGNVLLFSSSYQSGGLWMSRARDRED